MLYFKAFLQFSVIVSSCAGCYALTTYTMQAVTKSDLFEYFLVDAVVATENKEDGALFTKKQKNYKCKLSDKKFDDDCKLFKLSSEASMAGVKNKSISLQSLLNEDSLLKEEVKAETYVLKLSKNSIYEEILTSNIFLKSTKNPQKSFASLRINQHLKSSTEEIKSSFATVKYIFEGTRENDLAVNTEFLCDIGKDKAVPCILKAFENETNSYTFEKANIPTTTSSIQLNQYFLLEINDTNKSKTSAEFKEKQIKIAEKESPNKTLGTLKFEQLILKNRHDTLSSPYFPVIERKTWLVTSTLGSDSRVNEPLLTSNSWQKNYKCKVSGSEKEMDCDLRKLNYARPKNSSSFSNTKYSLGEVMKKTDLKVNRFFKLRINSDQLASLKLDGSETIDVINKTSKALYSTLTPKFELKQSHIHGNKNLMFGSFSTSLTGNPTTFKCKLPNKETSEVCDVYKFGTEATNVSSAHFSTTEKVSATSEITAGTKLVLDLKNQSLITTNDEQAISITVESTPSQTTQFAVEDQLIGIINQSTNNKIIFTK